MTDRLKAKENLPPFALESEPDAPFVTGNFEHYRTLFHSVDEGFCICEMIFDADGNPIDYRYLEINPVFEQISGLSNAAGKTVRELVPNLEQHWFEAFGNVVKTGEPARVTNHSETLNRWFDVSALRIGDKSENKFALLFRDITKAKESERLLRESEARFRQMADDAPVMIWVTQADGFCTYLSQTWYDFTGQTPETGLGFGWLNAAHPDDQARAEKVFLEATEQRGAFSVDYRLRRRDGAYRWMIDSAQPRFDSEGNFLGYIGSVLDVTERESVKRERDRFLNLASNLQILVDLEGYYRWVSPAWENLVGWTPEEMTSRPWREFIHPDDLDATLIQSENVIEGGAVITSFELRFLCKNGEYRWISWAARSFDDEQLGYCIGTDITKRKQSEQALRESDARLRLAIGISRTSIFQIDLLTDAVETDEIGREIYGFAADQKLTFADLQAHLHPLDRDKVMRAVASSLELNGSHEFEVEQRIIRTNGETRWIRVRGRTFFEGETAVRSLGTYIDVTNDRLREIALRESQSHLRMTTEAGGIGTWQWSVSDDKLLWSPIHLQMWGYDALAGEITFDDWRRRVHPEDLPKAEKAVADTLEKQHPYDIEYRITPQHSDEVRWIRSTGQVVLNERGEVTQLLGVSFDITATKKIEVERENLLRLEQSARAVAEDANIAKDEFLAIVSHELRSPLNSILGWNNMLRKQPTEKMVDRVTEIVERQGKQQLQLIEDLLDTARIISGKMRIEQESIDLAAVISAALDVVRPIAQSKRVSLSMILSSSDAVVTGDANRLQQIVWNLLANAVKFTPEDGRVEIELRRVDAAAEIIIRDNGKGIAADFLPYVFDRFRQSDSSSTRRYAGLGLGLSLVKQLTELHLGTIEAESAGENSGATFTVRFPIRAVDLTPLAESPDVPAPNGMLAGARILVADDLPDARELVSYTLERFGATVTTAESGAAALNQLGDNEVDAKFDVFICDIGMPDEDGYAVIKRLRRFEAERGGNLPAIALTAFVDSQDRLDALDAGFQMHVGKPVNPDELASIVGSLLTVKRF